MQGRAESLVVRATDAKLTDGGGMVVLRKLWDVLGIGESIRDGTQGIGGMYRPETMVEMWAALVLHGERVMDELPQLESRGVADIFGWEKIPDPSTFGRWLRRVGAEMPRILEEEVWRITRSRWEANGGVPAKVTLCVDSTVSVRYGLKQAGAKKGYDPRKKGRPSHHPLLVFVQETGDCAGVPGGRATRTRRPGAKRCWSGSWLDCGRLE